MIIKKCIIKISNLIPDRIYLKIKYRLKMKKKLNLKNPQTYNEKLQWLKLNDRKEIYTTMVDKYEVKKYVANIIGEEYIIPTLGIYNSFEEINFENLPEKFVMKCTHNSGGIIICKNKKQFDKRKAKKILEDCLKENFYYQSREWPYKNVIPRIIVEEYIEDNKEKDLKDYKFFCFDGNPKLLFIAIDRPKNTKFNFYDINFKKLPFSQHYENFNKKVDKPKKYNEMIKLSKKLSKGIPHIRVDFYEVNGKVYFGELTFFHFAGFEMFEPNEWDYRLGKLINIKKCKKNGGI